MTDPLLLTDRRAYWLTGTDAKPLPPGEPDRLEVEVACAFAPAAPTRGSFTGKVRPPKVSIQIDVRGHLQLEAPREGGHRPVMRVVDSEARWDQGANQVQLGAGYIEVLCPSSAASGLGPCS